MTHRHLVDPCLEGSNASFFIIIVSKEAQESHDPFRNGQSRDRPELFPSLYDRLQDRMCYVQFPHSLRMLQG